MSTAQAATTVESGPLTGWPTATTQNGTVIAIGRYSWASISGDVDTNEAWAAWTNYWANEETI
jgi:hypothetical protein